MLVNAEYSHHLKISDMDLIDRLIFTAINQVPRTNGQPPANPIISLANVPNFYVDVPGNLLGGPVPAQYGGSAAYRYRPAIRNSFVTIEDTAILENAIQKHWFDVVDGRSYNVLGNGTVFDGPFNALPPYHLIYAYLLENTRIAQIFEKLLMLYLHDEQLTKVDSNYPLPFQPFQWMMNTEALFFRDPPSASVRMYTGYLRPAPESVRRNAYYRLFGLDLSFGDITNNNAKYHKAEFANNNFILLFESFMREFWQAYINARNTSGPNTTDYFSLCETAQKLQQMLMSRRNVRNDFTNYKYFNLSREEYGSVTLMSWLFEAISFDSPLMAYLRCTANTPGERLIDIGQKVGIPAHSKSELIFEMAPPLALLLRFIEGGQYNPTNQAYVASVVQAQANGGPAIALQTLNSILLIINYWEILTGHALKNMPTPVTPAAIGYVRPPSANGTQKRIPQKQA